MQLIQRLSSCRHASFALLLVALAALAACGSGRSGCGSVAAGFTAQLDDPANRMRGFGCTVRMTQASDTGGVLWMDVTCDAQDHVAHLGDAVAFYAGSLIAWFKDRGYVVDSGYYSGFPSPADHGTWVVANLPFTVRRLPPAP